MDSVWDKDAGLPRFPRLEGDRRTDVLIVGGGLAGLLCAERLKSAGVDCLLVEKDRIMGGVSGRTTAKITAQHGVCYRKLLQKLGRERARAYFQANADAVRALAEKAKTADCAFEKQTAYLYATGSLNALVGELEAYDGLALPYVWEDSLPLPFSVAGALGMPEQGQFHPLKFASHIAKDLPVLENTKALAYVGDGVQTPYGKITAEKIIVATHFPLWNKHGAYFLKLYQQRSYVLALESGEKVEGMYLDCRDNGLSLRSAGKWLLLGGGGHRTGKTGENWRLPEAVAAQYYPNAPITARWATQDCMTLDGVPYVGAYSKAAPNLFVATGFGKWGMSGSMAAATVLADLVQGRENPYAELFSPSRSMFHGQLFINGGESVCNLLRPTKPRCPHLGCALRWNRQERSWDCPCHGSRFDERGNVLDNPATGDLKTNEN